MKFYKQYPSGLRLICEQMPNVYSVSFGVYVDVGCIREEAENNGYSHFIEHLLFKGTERRSSLQISEELENIGASSNAFTAKDCTCFYTRSIAGDLDKCMDVVSDMYFNAAFPPDEMELERGVVLEEINMCADNPSDLAGDLIGQASYFGQSLGQTILGNPKNIKYCDRHSIMNFKNKHYLPSATVVSVAGALEFAAVDELVQKYFENHYLSTSESLAAEPTPQVTSVFLHEFKDVEQSHLELNWGGSSLCDKDVYAVAVLSDIMGGGMTSRLVQEIREKRGLAYSVFCGTSLYKNCGGFEIYAGYNPKNSKQIAELVLQETQKITENGVTRAEVERSVMLSVNSIYMAAEANMSLMRLNGRRILKTDKPFDIEQEVAAYKAVTVEAVNAAAKRIFSTLPACAYVGPKSDKQFDSAAKLFKVTESK